ncbi:uncharacterized protein LOC115136522 [Oncorhynchus nerka]|uniref:uncharacterized protein LOC115136522 n=1 Tax=Oncorhynchus nerka TaxID=8023 RepID=UPI0031B84580
MQRGEGLGGRLSAVAALALDVDPTSPQFLSASSTAPVASYERQPSPPTVDPSHGSQMDGRFWQRRTDERLRLLRSVNGGSHSLYSSVGDDVSLPCTNVVHPDCSSTVWLFSRTESHSATEKVFQGKIQNEGNEGSESPGVGSDCSLRVRNIGTEDTGVYVCRQYPTDGRVLSANICGPLTFDSFVRDIVRVSWVNETGGELQGDSRYQVTRVSGCDITLTVKLWRKDKNRKWWCQLTEGTRKTFVYLTSKVSA